MLPGRSYSIIYRAIKGNCTLQQFVDTYCTVLNKEKIDCGSQDILKRGEKKVLQTQKSFQLCFPPGLLSSLCYSYPCFSKTSISWEWVIAGISINPRIWSLPGFILKPILMSLVYLPVFPFPDADLLLVFEYFLKCQEAFIYVCKLFAPKVMPLIYFHENENRYKEHNKAVW